MTDEYKDVTEAAKAAIAYASAKLQSGSVPDPDGKIHDAFEKPPVKSAFTHNNSEVTLLRGKLDQIYQLMTSHPTLQKQFPDIIPRLQEADIRLYNLATQGFEFIINDDGSVLSVKEIPLPLGKEAQEMQTAYTQAPAIYIPEGPGF